MNTPSLLEVTGLSTGQSPSEAEDVEETEDVGPTLERDTEIRNRKKWVPEVCVQRCVNVIAV